MRQVRFGKKPERHAGAVVEVGRFIAEAFPSGVNEAEIEGRACNGEAQPFRRKTLQLVIEGEAVNEHGARRVGSVWREPAVKLFVEFDRERFFGAAGNVVVHRRDKFVPSQLGENFLTDRFKTKINMMQLNCGRVRRSRLPELPDGAGQQAQHAAHALEILKGRGLGRERVENFGMQRIAGAEGFDGFRVVRVRGQQFFVGKPERAVGFDGGRGLLEINLSEEAAEQHLNRFVILSRIQERRLAGRNAFRLGHLVGDKLIFGAVSIARFAFLADGERVNQRHTRVAFDGFEQRREKGTQLFASGVAVEIAGLAEINGKFVQQDDARFTAEQFGERFRTGRGVALVALADALVTGFAGERASKFAPRSVGENAVVHAATIGRVSVLAVEGGDADFRRGNELRINKLGDVGDALHAVGSVGQRNEAVGLAAAIAGIEAEDASGGAGVARETSQDIAQKIFQPRSRIGVGKKTGGNFVVIRGRAANDLGEVGCKVRIGNRAIEHVLSRDARFKDGC